MYVVTGVKALITMIIYFLVLIFAGYAGFTLVEKSIFLKIAAMFIAMGIAHFIFNKALKVLANILIFLYGPKFR